MSTIGIRVYHLLFNPFSAKPIVGRKKKKSFLGNFIATFRDVVPVPVPKYQNWYPYPSTHRGTRTRTVPVFQHGLVPVLVPIPISLYPYRGTSTRTHISAQLGTRTCTYGLVPVPGYLFWYHYPYQYLVPIPIKSVNPSSFVSIILVPLLLHYPTLCTHVYGFVSLYLQCSDSTDTYARFVDYVHSAKKRCFT